MELDQLDIDSTAETRRYERAIDTACTLEDWLNANALGVVWRVGEVNPETYMVRINGFETYVGNGVTNALLYFAGSLDSASGIVAEMARNTAAT